MTTIKRPIPIYPTAAPPSPPSIKTPKAPSAITTDETSSQFSNHTVDYLSDPLLSTFLGFSPTVWSPPTAPPPPVLPPPATIDDLTLTSPYLPADRLYLATEPPRELEDVLLVAVPEQVVRAARRGWEWAVAEARQEKEAHFKKITKEYIASTGTRQKDDEPYFSVDMTIQEANSDLPPDPEPYLHAYIPPLINPPPLLPTSDPKGKSPLRPLIEPDTNFLASAFSSRPPSKKPKTLTRLLLRPHSNSNHTGESSTTGAARGILKNIYRKLTPFPAEPGRRGIPVGSVEEGEEIWEWLVARHGERTSGSNEMKETAKQSLEPVECVSCLDDFPPNQTVKMPCHHYCLPCLITLLETATKNESLWPPKCCLSPIPESLYQFHIPALLLTTLRSRATEWAIPPADRVYCHRAACSLFISPLPAHKAIGIATCPAGHKTCIICRQEAHKSTDCPQDPLHRQLQDLAMLQGWMPCHKCKRLIEHVAACWHMTCRCGGQFCYVCGAVWQTCRCTEADHNRKKNEVAARVKKRREEEEKEEEKRMMHEAMRKIAEEEAEKEKEKAAEEREIREILKFIEEAEEEHFRLEWAERERLEELNQRRKAYIALRITEVAKIKKLEDASLSWYAALDTLAIAQSRALDAAAIAARSTLTYSATTAISQAKDATAHSLATAAETDTAKLSAFKSYQAARLEEHADYARTLAAHYRLQLTAHYHGYSDAEERISGLMAEYHAGQAGNYHGYLTHQQAELTAMEFEIAEGRIIREEVAEARIREVEEEFGKRAAVLEMGIIAREQWVEIVRRRRREALEGVVREEREIVAVAREGFTKDEIVEDVDIEGLWGGRVGDETLESNDGGESLYWDLKLDY